MMSNEPPKIEAPPRRPPWDKIDPILQRTAWGITIAVGVLALISNFVVPYFEVFAVLIQFAAVGWHVLQWRKKKSYLVGWWIQPLFVLQIAMAVMEAGFYFSRGDRLLAGFWLCAGLSWTALLVLATREQHNALREEHDDLWSALLKIATAQGKIVDILHNLTERQHDIVKMNRTEMEVCKPGTDKSELLPGKTPVLEAISDVSRSTEATGELVGR